MKTDSSSSDSSSSHTSSGASPPFPQIDIIGAVMNNDCLESKMENYQVCCVQYCVQQLCTVQGTHMNRPNSCMLVRFSFSVVILCVTVYLCYI